MRVLWVKTELLHPIDKGGKIRTYHTLRGLCAAHDVTYLTLHEGPLTEAMRTEAAEYCHTLVTVPATMAPKGSARFWRELAVNALSPLPYAVAKYRSAALRDRIRALVRDPGVDLVVCDFLAPSINVPGDLGVPTVLFQHNVEASIWKRHADVADSALRRAYMRSQWRRMRAFEQRECRRFSHVIAVSDDDREAFRHDYGVEHVTSVPTGVDVDFFRPGGTTPVRPGSIVFTGSMDWMPNEDGVEWFAGSILPRVRDAVPGATLEVVGRNPSRRVSALAERYPGVTVTGTVPDIRPYLEAAAVVVVPLRVGGGTRLKIYEAMAMERAVVSTTIGAEGLPVSDGGEIVIADDPAAFAEAVASLLREPGRAREIGVAAARRVRHDFSWPSAVAEFVRTCERVAGRAGAGPGETSPHRYAY